MKYNLSEQQWRTLWQVKHKEWQNSDYSYNAVGYNQSLSEELNGRLCTFNKLYKEQFKLCYNEYDGWTWDANLKEEDHPDYWGYVEGEEKDITLFLLSI